MSLLYQIVIDYIDELIEKKRKEIEHIENNIFKSLNYKHELNELHRLINLLFVVKHKFGELFSFVQDAEK